MNGQPRTIVFDVNETLSDVSGLAPLFEEVGAPASLVETWYAATLRDGIALAAMGSSATFADISRGVLDRIWNDLPNLEVSPQDATAHILSGFNTLSLHPDIAPGVVALSDAGHRLVTLSNGARSVAVGLMERAGLSERFWQLLSADDAGVWKPHRGAYEYAAQQCGLPTTEIILVAVHPWDLAGAHSAGMQTAYLDRTASPFPSVFPAPDYTVRRLADLAAALA